MSYGCMYILRNAKEVDRLCKKLICTAMLKGYAVNLEPMNNLLLDKAVKLGDHDFIFEVCDNPISNVPALLISYDGRLIDGQQAQFPLVERLALLQEIAGTCLSHTDRVEIYLGEDTPYLPDYSVFSLRCGDIADTLYQQYQLSQGGPWIPCVHLIIG